MSTTTARASGIQNGAKTHNQDQAMTLVNFRAMNKRVNRPRKPTPFVELLLKTLSSLFDYD